jgi:hypothetical protein
MSGDESVVFAFLRIGESADTAEFAQGAENLPPAGQYFVSVGLMSHVPNDAIVGRIEDVMQCDRQLRASQARSEMPRIFGQNLDHVLAQFLTYLFQLIRF